MATKKKAPSKAYAFLQAALRRNPKAAYADIAERAKAKRIKLAPVLYGKVKLDLGLVKRKPKKTKTATATRRGPGHPRKDGSPPRRGPGRPRKVGSPLRRGPGRPRKVATLDSIAAQIQQLQAERDHAVAALEKISAVLGTM